MALNGNYEPSTFDWVRDQVELYERTDGREGGLQDGRPVIILSTRGARSGALRKSPLMRLEHDGVYGVVGSVGGFPRDPAWVHNLRADPRCEVRDGADRLDMIAREAAGGERQRWWDDAVAAYPHYAELQDRTDRQFPVVLLEPAP